MSLHTPTTESHTDPASHDAHSADHVRKHLKLYYTIFGALLVLTLITVGASYIDFGSSAANITVALIIATVKATLVAGFFMHLTTEKATIHRFLVATVIFAIALFALTALQWYDPIIL